MSPYRRDQLTEVLPILAFLLCDRKGRGSDRIASRSLRVHRGRLSTTKVGRSPVGPLPLGFDSDASTAASDHPTRCTVSSPHNDLPGHGLA